MSMSEWGFFFGQFIGQFMRGVWRGCVGGDEVCVL